jgi:hypothetical protein
MAKKKAFAGERFILADSRSLGRSPWDTQVQNHDGTAFEIRSDIRNTRRWNCPLFLSVSYHLRSSSSIV